MKKHLILSFIALPFIFGVIGCKKDDSKNCYNPPSWIIGTWKDTGPEGSGTVEFRFTENDIFQVIAGSEVSNCTLNQSNGFNAVEGKINDDIYYYQVSGTNEKFYFERISSSTIRHYFSTPPPTNSVFNELIKQ